MLPLCFPCLTCPPPHFPSHTHARGEMMCRLSVRTEELQQLLIACGYGMPCAGALVVI